MNADTGHRPMTSTRGLESELSAWLRGFEPAGAPISLRLRTYADLRDEADAPRRRLQWLLPALSSAASYAAVAVAAGMIALIALTGATVNRVAGGILSATGPIAGVTQIPGPDANGADPVGFVLLVAASCLVGYVAVHRTLWDLASRLLFGALPAGPIAGRALTAAARATFGAPEAGVGAPPPPLRRPWRSVAVSTWVLAALAIAMAGAVAAIVLREGLSIGNDPMALYGIAIDSLMIVALVWRHPGL
jgi:hypothetical protein